MEDLKESIFLRLKHSVQLLALPPEAQLGLLPLFVCKADELALEFDHWYEVALANFNSDLNVEQQSALEALKQKFGWLTENAKGEWTIEAVKESREWQEVRSLATRILNSFGWAIESPPSYAHEYISNERSSSRN
jgi:hypothetical protein